ncbi:MAG: hypothetical protein MR555_08335 [Spirochaetia bacterium]|nr:hypothetical protein [Spirochaetia bacterium]
MKIMKKIAVAVFAGAMVFGLASCGGAGDDDPNKMIKGSNKVYTIDYTSETEENSRGYNATAYKHAGAAVQLDFENVSNTFNGGVMGLIFDLEEKDGVKSFNIIGVKANDANGGLGYYVSRFENVTDLQAVNFGTGLTENPATETKYAPKGKDTFGAATGVKNEEKDTITVYAYAIEKKATEDGTDSAEKAYKKDEFIYKVYLLNDKVGKLDSEGKLINEEGNELDLSKVDPAATIATGYTSLTQKKLAVYANVYGNKTLKGTWTYRGSYKEVGVDED